MKAYFFSFLFIAVYITAFAKKPVLINADADAPHILYSGRTDQSDPKAVRFAWPGVSIRASFEGTVCNLRMKDLPSGSDAYGNPHRNYYNVIIDGRAPFVIAGDPAKEIYKIDTLKPGLHFIIIFKRTEALVGETVFYGFQLEKGKKILPYVYSSNSAPRGKIEFIGNSITCGYGNEGKNKDCKFSGDTENNYLAYGAIAARKLHMDYSAVAFSGKGLYMNYDQTTDETMPDLYDRALPFDGETKWDFKKWTPDVVVINLGTNDFAHQNPDSAVWVSRYLAFLKILRSHYPQAHIVCSIGPMMSDNWPVGNKALSTIKKYLQTIVASAHTSGDSKVHLFFFTPQSGNLGCDWHPGLKTHEKMAEDLVGFIEGDVLK